MPGSIRTLGSVRLAPKNRSIHSDLAEPVPRDATGSPEWTRVRDSLKPKAVAKDQTADFRDLNHLLNVSAEMPFKSMLTRIYDVRRAASDNENMDAIGVCENAVTRRHATLEVSHPRTTGRLESNDQPFAMHAKSGGAKRLRRRAVDR